MSIVTSRGCSRAIVLCVLHRCLEFVQEQFELGETVQFPFSKEVVQLWIDAAREDCQEVSFQTVLGGTMYDSADETTFWTVPQQFFTWWKNNVERKSKFQSLQRDASYHGSNDVEKERAIYCRAAVAIATNIKKHFDRFTTTKSKARVPKIKLSEIPFEFPVSLRKFKPVSVLGLLSMEDSEVARINTVASVSSDDEFEEEMHRSPVGIDAFASISPHELGFESKNVEFKSIAISRNRRSKTQSRFRQEAEIMQVSPRKKKVKTPRVLKSEYINNTGSTDNDQSTMEVMTVPTAVSLPPFRSAWDDIIDLIPNIQDGNPDSGSLLSEHGYVDSCSYYDDASHVLMDFESFFDYESAKLDKVSLIQEEKCKVEETENCSMFMQIFDFLE